MLFGSYSLILSKIGVLGTTFYDSGTEFCCRNMVADAIFQATILGMLPQEAMGRLQEGGIGDGTG